MAGNLSNWIEGIIVIILFVAVFGGILTSLNLTHNKTYATELDTSTPMKSFKNFQESVQNKVQTGDASFIAYSGLILTTSWDIIVSGSNIVWSFISGSWIYTLCDWIKAPDGVATGMVIIYFISVGLLVLRLLFKITP